MSNQRFSIAVHILTLLTHFKDRYIQSSFNAASVNVNPVIVRRVLGLLKKGNLVESKEGQQGGSRLAVDPERITLWEVFELTNQEFLLSALPTDPNQQCLIGRNINERLSNLFNEVNDSIAHKLKSNTIADFHRQFV